MRVMTHATSMVGGIIVATTAFVLWLCPTSSLYTEGRIATGIIAVLLGLAITSSNIYYLVHLCRTELTRV